MAQVAWAVRVARDSTAVAEPTRERREVRGPVVQEVPAVGAVLEAAGAAPAREETDRLVGGRPVAGAAMAVAAAEEVAALPVAEMAVVGVGDQLAPWVRSLHSPIIPVPLVRPVVMGGSPSRPSPRRLLLLPLFWHLRPSMFLRWVRTAQRRCPGPHLVPRDRSR